MSSDSVDADGAVGDVAKSVDGSKQKVSRWRRWRRRDRGGAGQRQVRWWHNSRSRLTFLRVLISAVAAVAFGARLIWPWLKLDAISLGLLIVAVIPWASGLFESLEFPGGWKISFRSLQKAGSVIPDVGATDTEGAVPSYLAIRDLDPALGLVGLRIEIETRLQRLDPQPDGRPRAVPHLIRRLVEHNVIDRVRADALTAIVRAGNHAAHGAEVSDDAAEFAFTEGPRILTWLDSLRPLDPV